MSFSDSGFWPRFWHPPTVFQPVLEAVDESWPKRFLAALGVLSHLKYQFQICVDRYQGNRYVKEFSYWDQFLCLVFAQLTYRESLRDIEACLRAQQSKLYHMGFRGLVSRNTLAHANEVRDWRIYRDFAQVLIPMARDLYRDEPLGVELSGTVYAFDSTTIDLCLSLFPWGQFRRRKSAVKLHTLLDVRGSIPTNVYVTGGQVHDVNLLDINRLIFPHRFSNPCDRAPTATRHCKNRFACRHDPVFHPTERPVPT